MDDKDFSTDVINKTIRKLNTSDKWLQSYTNLFQGLLDNNKLSNPTEIYNKIVDEVND